MRSNEFDTAEMMKRLQRQVSRLRSGDTEDSVTIIQNVREDAVVSDSVTVTEEASDGFEWSSDGWSMSSW